MDSNPSSSPSPSCASPEAAADMGAGFSPCPPPPPPPPPLASHAGGEWRTRGSHRGARFFFVDDFCDEPRHFLDSCFLCKRPLAGNRDIFMYRGDTPFCSVECRQEQIEMDEASEKRMQTSRKSSSEKQSSSKSENIHVRADTAVVAG